MGNVRLNRRPEKGYTKKKKVSGEILFLSPKGDHTWQEHQLKSLPR